MALFEVKDIVKDYTLGRTTIRALKGVDLTIEPGKFACIVGPSGCGKTNLVGCIDRPSSGELRFDGQLTSSFSDDAEAELRLATIGFIFQSFNLVPVLPVAENIEVPMLLAHVGKRQRQRVAIARALANRPRLVIAGMRDRVRRKTTEETAHILVESEARAAAPDPLDPRLFLKDSEVLAASIAADARVARAEPMLPFGALIVAGETNLALRGYGVAPGTGFFAQVGRGARRGGFPFDGPGIAVSEKALALLGEPDANSLIVLAGDVDGAPVYRELPVACVFTTDDTDFDNATAFVDADSAAELLGVSDAGELRIRLHESDRADEVVRDLEPGLAAAGATARSWGSLQGDSLAVAATVITNAILMRVFEKQREYATLRAIGLKRRQQAFLVLLEGAGLGLAGAFLGAALALPVVRYFQSNGLPIGEASRIFGGGDVMYFGTNLRVTLQNVGFGVLIALAGSAYAARNVFRNVFRNKRRSILNIVAVALGVALMFVCLGWVQGYEPYIFKAVRNFQSGSAHVLASGFQAVAARFPLDLTVNGYRQARSERLVEAGVTGASGRLDFPVRLIAAGKSVRLLGQGGDGRAAAAVTVLRDKIVRGAYLGDGPGLLIGAKLAARLGVSPGTMLMVEATDRYGVVNRFALPLNGLFDFGFPAMDNQIAFIDLNSAQDLLDLGDEVTRVALAGPVPDQVARAARRYAASRAAAEPDLPALLAHGWQEFAKATVSGVRTDTYSFYVVAAILFALIIIGILNSMPTAVHERHRELAALRAVGLRAKEVRRLILYESLALSVIATAAGLLLAAPIAVWLGYFGLDIAANIPEGFPIPFGEVYHADYRLWHAVLSIALGIGASLAGSLLPARRAARLPIAETIGAGI